jgi:hypothetical protein
MGITWKCASIIVIYIDIVYIYIYIYIYDVYVLRPESLCGYEAGESGHK